MKDINRKVYTDAIESVSAPKELVLNVQKLGCEMAKENTEDNIHKRKYYRRIVAAAAVAFLVLVVPNTSVAGYVKEIFAGFWGSQKEVEPFVKNGVHIDKDKHIQISVEEVMSDGVCVQAVVKYTAKDEDGVKWLKNYKLALSGETDDCSFKDELCVEPDFKHGHGVSGACSYAELEEYKSDEERYFTVQYLAVEPIEKCILHYSLTSGAKEMEIDISCNVPVYEYNLKAEGGKEISRFYKPKKIRISRLSIVAFGKDTGLITEDSNEFKQELSKEYMAEHDTEAFRSVKMVKRDGSKEECDFIGAFLGGIGKKAMEENEGCDCLVFSQNFCHLDYKLDEKGNLKIDPSITNIQPEEIVGIELKNARKKVLYWFE